MEAVRDLRRRVDDGFVALRDGPSTRRAIVARMRADAAVAPGQIFDFAVNMEKAVAFDPVTEARILP